MIRAIVAALLAVVGAFGQASQIPYPAAGGAVSGTGAVLAQSGALAAVPITGDGTLNTSTGVLTVTKTNGIPFTSAATTANVTSTFAPFGGLDSSYASATMLGGAAGAVWFAQILIPAPGIILNYLKGFQPAAGNVGHMAMGLYNSACALVAQSSTVTGSGLQQMVSFPFSGLALPGGSYYVAFSSDNGAATFFASTGSGYLGAMWNTSETASTYRVFTGAASNTTAGVTTLPSTCGTRSALGAGGTSYFPSLVLQ